MGRTETESVWVKSRGRSGSGSSITIHTDPGCEALKKANAVSQKARNQVPDDWPECPLCGSEYRSAGGVPEGEDPQALRTKLLETDPDAIGFYSKTTLLYSKHLAIETV